MSKFCNRAHRSIRNLPAYSSRYAVILAMIVADLAIFLILVGARPEHRPPESLQEADFAIIFSVWAYFSDMIHNRRPIAFDFFSR